MPKKIECPLGTAHCSRCKQFLPVDQFRPAGKRLSRYCKKCALEYDRTRLGRTPRFIAPDGMKRCPHCATVKPLAEFGLSKTEACGHQCYCRACMSNYAYRENPERRARAFATSLAWGRAHCRHPRVYKNLPPSAWPTDTDLAYYAGLFDAEGTFGMQPKTTLYSGRVAFYNNDADIIERVATAFGGKVTTLRQHATHSELGACFTNVHVVRNVCEALLPYLVLKRNQAALLIRAIDMHPEDRVPLREELMRLNATCQRHEFPKVDVGAQCDTAKIVATDWAYLAGWIDGDGTLTMQPQKWGATRYFYPWVSVYSTKPVALVHLYAIFGGTLKSRNRSSAQSTEGELKFVDQHYVGDILRGVIPYLTLKKERAELMLQSLAHPASERQEYRDKVHALNVAGRHPRENQIEDEGQELEDAVELKDVARVYDLKDIAAVESGAAWPKGVEHDLAKKDEKPVDATVSTLAQYAAKAS